jgi:hypothetical protein
MFMRGGETVSLHDASRRLQVPVEVLWRWIAEGTLEADVQPGRGFGMEYSLNSDQLKRARELRDLEVAKAREEVGEQMTAEEAAPEYKRADNIIAFDFGENRMEKRQQDSWLVRKERDRNSVMIAMENLRNDTLAAVQRQGEREAAMLGMVGAVDLILTTTLKAMARAQDFNQAQLTAELETLRSRLADHVQSQEQEELALRDELARAKEDLTAALKTMNPDLDLAGMDPSGQPQITAAEAPTIEEQSEPLHANDL